jgi:ABC-type multidrug transport system fused ATPase/permease subunit
MAAVYDPVAAQLQMCADDREAFVVGRRSDALAFACCVLALSCLSVAAVALLHARFVIAGNRRRAAPSRDDGGTAGRKPRLGDDDDDEDDNPSKTAQFPILKNVGGWAVSTSNLSYYPSKTAQFPILKRVCVRLAYGTLVAVMGPSGSGKTTFLEVRILAS